jgi:hypothetical protein
MAVVALLGVDDESVRRRVLRCPASELSIRFLDLEWLVRDKPTRAFATHEKCGVLLCIRNEYFRFFTRVPLCPALWPAERALHSDSYVLRRSQLTRGWVERSIRGSAREPEAYSCSSINLSAFLQSGAGNQPPQIWMLFFLLIVVAIFSATSGVGTLKKSQGAAELLARNGNNSCSKCCCMLNHII